MKKYLSNLLWLLSDRVFMLVFQLSLFASIKRIYGLDILGSWATIMNISQILLSLFLFGIDIVVVKRIVENPSSTGTEIGCALFLQFLGLLLYASAFITIVIYFYYDIPFAFIFVAILIVANFFSLYAKVIFFHYSALVESKYRAITILSSVAVSYGYLWCCIYFGWHVFYAYVFFYLIQALFSFTIYKFYFPYSAKWTIDLELVKMYFFMGSKLIVSTISVSLFTQCDVILLESLTGTKEAGAFSAALRLSAIWFMCGGLIANAFFPKIVQLEKIGEEESFIFLKWICGVVSVISIYGAIIMIALSPIIIKILYGDNMDLSAQVLMVHMWSGVFVFLGSFSSKWLFSKNYINLEVIKTIIAAILNITLNIIVIPKYGAVGAASVSLLSYFIANFLIFIF
ncbi:O38 family O-antigen flippase, partial [Escherichia coli]